MKAKMCHYVLSTTNYQLVCTDTENWCSERFCFFFNPAWLKPKVGWWSLTGTVDREELNRVPADVTETNICICACPVGRRNELLIYSTSDIKRCFCIWKKAPGQWNIVVWAALRSRWNRSGPILRFKTGLIKRLCWDGPAELWNPGLAPSGSKPAALNIDFSNQSEMLGLPQM